MTQPRADVLSLILRTCAAAAPAPWYPRSGPQPPLPRHELNLALERLRLAGLVTLTEWTRDHGQGYVLTPTGVAALDDPRRLDRLADDPSGFPGAAPDSRGVAAETDPTEPGTADRADTRADEIRDALLTPSTPQVTYVLIALNVLVFLVEYSGILFRGRPASDWLALRPIDLLHGGYNWLRLLGCAFVHANWMHLLMNMYALYILGPLVERLLGKARFLALYLVAALGGSCVAAAVMGRRGFPGLNTPLVGASGAICGLMAAFAVWVFLNRQYLPRALVSSWTRNLVTVFILNVILSFLPQISAAAHFGGGAVGALAAAILVYHRYGGHLTRAAALAALVLLPLGCLAGLVAFMQQSPAWAGARDLMPQIDQQRQAQEREVKADQERSRINKVLPQVQDLEKVPLAAFRERVQPLLDRHVSRRDPGAVQAALNSLDESLKPLQQAAEFLRQQGPFQDEEVEAARRTRLELVQARLDVLAQSRKVLQLGPDVQPEDETRLRQCERHRDEMEKRWKAMLR